MTTDPPSLKPLHPEESLSPAKLAKYDGLATEELIDSLAPGGTESLKVRPNGTVLNGNHRIQVLRNRGVYLDRLPREIVPKEDLPSDRHG
jgi:hypothetical protein